MSDAASKSASVAVRYQYVSATLECPTYALRMGIMALTSRPSATHLSMVCVQNECLHSYGRGGLRSQPAPSGRRTLLAICQAYSTALTSNGLPPVLWNSCVS